MSARLYVRGGSGLGGGTEIPHISEITEFAPSFEGKQPLIELGMSFANGAASQGTFVTNPTLMFGTPGGVFAPHAQVTWTEDASGDELWLAQGRTSGEEEGRGIPLAEDIVEHVVTVDDANVDTRGLAFTEDWVRPAETGTDRLYALDAYILSAGSSTSPTLRYSTDITISDSHLAPDTNTVTMPAKTYPAGTQPSEVINDCAETEGKVWGVVIHHVAGVSHLCLLYIQELDHSTFASPCKISDQVANWDPTDLTAPVFEPIWDQGKGLLYGGQTAVSGILSRYGQEDQFVYVNNPTLEDQNERWIESFSDADSVNATQAEARANSVLSYRQFGDFTYRATVVVLPEQFHLLGAGMSIQADTAVFPGGTFRGSYEDVRIIQLSWEPMPDGRYKAHMQLNRAPRTLAPSRGKPLPLSGAPTCEPDEIVAPTTIWHATYATDEKDDESSTYDFGLDRTTSGGFGDYPPANAFFGANYGRNNAGAYASAKMPWDENDELAFSMDILWRYTPSNRNVDLYWYDVSDVLLRVDRVISGAGRAVDTGYSDLGTTVTPPATATQVQVYYTNFAGLFGDNIYLQIPGSVVPADNSDYCLPAGSGSSPYPALSDDPRFASLEQQIADLEGGASALDWFIVTDPLYGAIGDGVADDTTAIQAAIDAAEVAGGVVYFPVGQYKITSALTVNPASASQSVMLRGAGFNGSLTDTYGSVIVQSTADTDGIVPGANCYHLFVEDLKITGPTGTTSYGIKATRNVHCTNVWIEGFWRGYGLLGTTGVQSYYSKNLNLTCYGAADTGVYLLAGVNNADFFGCRMNACGVQGLFIGGAWGVRIFGGAIEGNGTYGARIDSAGAGASGTTQPTRSTTFYSTYFENPSATDIRVGHDSAGTVYNVAIDSCQFISTATNHITGQYFDGLVLSNNFYQGGKSKVSFSSPGTNLTIVGHEFGAGSYGTLPAATMRVSPSGTLTPVATGTALATGSGPDVAYRDHVHTNAVIGAVTVSGTAAAGQVPTATSSSAATWQTPSASGGGGHILISDTHSTPLIFGDLLQTEAGDDLLYSDS